MAPPTKPPSTPQSNTLLQYFSRTPARALASGDGDNSNSTPPPPPGPSASSSTYKAEGTVSSPTTANGSSPTPMQKYEDETPKKSKSSAKKPKPVRHRIRVISDDSEDDENHTPPNGVAEEKTVKKDSNKDLKKAKKGKDDTDGDDEVEWVPSNDEEEEEEEDSGDTSSSSGSESDQDDSDTSPSSSTKKNSRQKSGGAGMKRKSTDSPRATVLQKKFKTLSGSPAVIKMQGKAKPNSLGKLDPKTPTMKYSSDDGDTQWPHLQLEWLKPDKIRDGNKRLMSDENYDPQTLDVPANFLNQQSPVQRQWWEIKSKHFDTILLFKMGKFYELFHMDSVTCVEVLNISYMKGDFAHCGFPEKALAKFANKLIEEGYKIARIEQTETPEMMNNRLKAKKQKGQAVPKVVNREVCQISTRGVRTASVQDNPYNTPFNPESAYLFGVYQKLAANGCPRFGVCFIDTTIGEFHIGQFDDDRHFSRLRTLFSHCPPAHVLLQKGNIIQQADELISSYARIRKELLVSSHFVTHDKALARLREDNYFGETSTGEIDWPDAIKTITEPGQLVAAEGYELAWQAFGCVVQYLKKCLVDHDLLSLKRFSIYRPVDSLLTSGLNDVPMPSNMVLDGITLLNLDITESSNPKFNLLAKVNKSCTAFGSRLVREWMCRPLAVPRDIEIRLDAIAELLSLYSDTCKRMESKLKSLPDLERLLNKVHMLGSAHRKKNHPDGRAIMFEEVTYSKNKIVDLISIIKGFKDCIDIIGILQDAQLKSQFFCDILSEFPELRKILGKFDDAFDHAAAKKEGKIIPTAGADSEYDGVLEDLAEVNLEAKRYLRQVSIDLGTKVEYFGTAKNRFQLEVSANTRVPNEFDHSSSKKGFKRYTNTTTKRLLEDTQRVETKREEILRDITRRIFEKFDKDYAKWKIAVDCIAKLDAILSLRKFCASQEGMCRPKVVYSEKPFIKIKDGRHPCISMDSYIANSCYLGVGRPNKLTPFGSFMLLTGPNMGGKSTLMRQVALIVVLAQMGCFVPASSCEMSVVDRIFTRLGASDNLGDGESTFFVELSETSSILQHCTKNSLVLMDELGRGTATYDGTAIAHAVACSLASKGIRSLFSTHYHTLVESVQHLPKIQLGHMACMVENECDDPTQETVTFLYKIAPGQCPKSYGFNAAKLAGLPEEVIRCGYQKAKEFELAASNVDAFRKIVGMSGNNLSIHSVMQLLKI